MKKLFLLCFVIVALSGCSNSSQESSECILWSEWKWVNEKEALETCNHFLIYEYRGQPYSVCECCTCDKLGPPVNCDGESVCPFDPFDLDVAAYSQCLAEFYEEAEFHFYMVER